MTRQKKFNRNKFFSKILPKALKYLTVACALIAGILCYAAASGEVPANASAMVGRADIFFVGVWFAATALVSWAVYIVITDLPIIQKMKKQIAVKRAEEADEASKAAKQAEFFDLMESLHREQDREQDKMNLIAVLANRQ